MWSRGPNAAPVNCCPHQQARAECLSPGISARAGLRRPEGLRWSRTAELDSMRPALPSHRVALHGPFPGRGPAARGLPAVAPPRLPAPSSQGLRSKPSAPSPSAPRRAASRRGRVLPFLSSQQRSSPIPREAPGTSGLSCLGVAQVFLLCTEKTLGVSKFTYKETKKHHRVEESRALPRGSAAWASGADGSGLCPSPPTERVPASVCLLCPAIRPPDCVLSNTVAASPERAAHSAPSRPVLFSDLDASFC